MRYGTEVDNAIREACARRERPSEVLVQLRAGTLPGIDRPLPGIADRTFWGKWSRAKRAIQMAERDADDDDGLHPILLRAAVSVMQRRGISDPEEIGKAIGVKPQQVREALAESAAREAERNRPDPHAERSLRIKRGRAMIVEGASLEEAAEVMEMPPP
jgi:hypothetical protein